MPSVGLKEAKASTKFANNRGLKTGTIASGVEPSVFAHEVYDQRSSRDDKLRADKSKTLRRKQVKTLQKEKVISYITDARKHYVSYRPTPKTPFVASPSVHENLQEASLDSVNRFLKIRALKHQVNKERRSTLKLESRHQTREKGDADIIVTNVPVKKMKKGQTDMSLGEREQAKLRRQQRNNSFSGSSRVSSSSFRLLYGLFKLMFRITMSH